MFWISNFSLPYYLKLDGNVININGTISGVCAICIFAVAIILFTTEAFNINSMLVRGGYSTEQPMVLASILLAICALFFNVDKTWAPTKNFLNICQVHTTLITIALTLIVFGLCLRSGSLLFYGKKTSNFKLIRKEWIVTLFHLIFILIAVGILTCWFVLNPFTIETQNGNYICTGQYNNIWKWAILGYHSVFLICSLVLILMNVIVDGLNGYNTIFAFFTISLMVPIPVGYVLNETIFDTSPIYQQLVNQLTVLLYAVIVLTFLIIIKFVETTVSKKALKLTLSINDSNRCVSNYLNHNNL
ncbi:hypothetical protein A3Q56_05382 [Intoshia linei]|uniref:G-protein coupled receptors family 3 profile domain-containing protein n=1 Tax=Intoshia linei TaxID=1819745 RepID=A0A177AY17_9BILA|nr:hypothetical protein A3Q56_05382 [Intoshia linei]